jgi:hypothetical protein
MNMSPIVKCLALLVGIGTFGLTQQAFAANYQCMTDDGYGRKLPCDFRYKAANPNWKASDACHTKGKGGKITPCSEAEKAKFAK